MNKRTIKYIGFFVALTVVFTACTTNDPNSPGFEFMNEMYTSPSLESNMATVINGDTISSNRLPAKGSIARGFLPYSYNNDTTGYRLAGLYLHSPLKKSEAVLADGEVLYNKFCDHCHGAQGKGDGPVGGKLPGAPPSYSGALKDLPEGKIFHSITYGKGLMGSHTTQLSTEERWKVVAYVQKLQHIDDVAIAPAVIAETTDSTKTTK